jgi:pimeloyl-ACP methyl ester carboxylesterase
MPQIHSHKSRRLLHLVAVLCCLAAGCSMFFPAPSPVRTIWRRCETGTSQRPLIVLLPGRGDGADQFVEQGFTEAVVRSGLADVVAVDATQGYYMRRTLIPRLFEDVVGPARKMGYRKIWLAGISMGGLGAILTAESDAAQFEGILLMAPFLGDSDVIDEIADAGGLAAWTPPAGLDVKVDYQRGVWRWLKGYTQKADAMPRLYLGFGTEDRFTRSNGLLAAVLPQQNVLRVPGEHDWPPWREVMAAFLRSGALSAPPRAASAQNVPIAPAP